jgi:hypothetical protein
LIDTAPRLGLAAFTASMALSEAATHLPGVAMSAAPNRFANGVAPVEVLYWVHG